MDSLELYLQQELWIRRPFAKTRGASWTPAGPAWLHTTQHLGTSTPAPTGILEQHAIDEQQSCSRVLHNPDWPMAPGPTILTTLTSPDE